MTCKEDAKSALDPGHVPFFVSLANRARQVVQPLDLRAVELEAVGRGVLLDAGDSLRAGDRRDVIALSEQPGQSNLRQRCTGFGGVICTVLIPTAPAAMARNPVESPCQRLD